MPPGAEKVLPVELGQAELAPATEQGGNGLTVTFVGPAEAVQPFGAVMTTL